MTDYFAYGLNMIRSEFEERCGSGCGFRGLARLPGWGFRLNGRGVATVVPSPGETVHGVLWHIDDAGERALDRFEGVAGGWYAKTTAPVEFDGGTVEALVYVAREDRPVRTRGGAYIGAIVLAADDLGLPADYVEYLRSWLGDAATG